MLLLVQLAKDLDLTIRTGSSDVQEFSSQLLYIWDVDIVKSINPFCY